MAETRTTGEAAKAQPTGFDLAGLNVLIIGDAQGIGRAVAETCAAQRADLILADLDAPAGIARRLEGKHGRTVRDFACNIADRGAVDKLAADLDQSGIAPDCVAVIAGITRYRDWIKASPEEWDDDTNAIFDVNLRGPINAARAFLPGMRQRKWGRFVMVGSLAGRMGGVTSQAHYVASKGGVHAMVRMFGLQSARDGVLVNAVAPGPTQTSMTEGRNLDVSNFPIGRVLDPDEIAWPIAFLLSPACSGMVGTILDVNGGIHFS
jgi:NAD(P)-dependent dehydrogenase (short-subunit alcohol dehydrogenase family)